MPNAVGGPSHVDVHSFLASRPTARMGSSTRGPRVSAPDTSGSRHPCRAQRRLDATPPPPPPIPISHRHFDPNPPFVVSERAYFQIDARHISQCRLRPKAGPTTRAAGPRCVAPAPLCLLAFSSTDVFCGCLHAPQTRHVTCRLRSESDADDVFLFLAGQFLPGAPQVGLFVTEVF